MHAKQLAVYSIVRLSPKYQFVHRWSARLPYMLRAKAQVAPKNINTTRRYTCYLACLKMCYAEFYCCHARGGKKIPDVQWEMRSEQARKFRIQWECAGFIFASPSSAVKNNSVSHTLQWVYLLVVFIFFG